MAIIVGNGIGDPSSNPERVSFVDWPAQCLAQRKSQKKYTKRKDRNR